MLGQPMFLPQPVVIGVRTVGALPAGTTATDLVLTLTQMLRAHGVVGKFVEFFGDGLSSLSIADRATLSNMCPEYGATSAYFPVDAETLRYLALHGAGRPGRPGRALREGAGPVPRATAIPSPRSARCSSSTSRRSCPSLAGPKRPQDRVALARGVGLVRGGVPRPRRARPEGGRGRPVRRRGRQRPRRATPRRRPRRRRPADDRAVGDGSVVIAAITSCTNTSNPSVMVAAGLLAQQGGRGRAADEAVGEDLARAGLARGHRLPRPRRAHALPRQARLRARRLRLHHVHRELGPADRRGGARGRRARPERRRGALGEPQLRGAGPSAGAGGLPRVAAARAWRTRSRDGSTWTSPPTRSGEGPDGPVYLADLWPTADEVRDAVAASITREQFDVQYARIWDGDELWRALPTPEGPIYDWDPASTYVPEPPFFAALVRRRAGRRHRGRARPGEGGRLDHHRPHLAGGLDQGRLAGGRVPAGARGRARATSTRTAPAAGTTR